MTDTCKRCGRVIQDGELVTGFDFSNEGGEHIHCPMRPTFWMTAEETEQELKRRDRVVKRVSEVAWAVFETGRDMEPAESVMEDEL